MPLEDVLTDENACFDFTGLSRKKLAKVVGVIAEVSAILGRGPTYYDADATPTVAIWTEDLPGATSSQGVSDNYVQVSWTDGQIGLDWDIQDSAERYALIGLRQAVSHL